jgi:3-deoxy-D-manno-octulosonic-acid transferase
MSVYDIAYAVGLTLAAPYWLIVPRTRRKVFTAFRDRMGNGPLPVRATGPAVMIHAVSVGELNAAPALIRALGDARPDLHFVISTTTSTGTDRAQELFASDLRVTLIRFPLDFSSAVRRILDNHHPTVVVLMELEVWPNFMAECQRRHIPVVIVNGRLTLSSFRGYRRLRPLTRGMFESLAQVCAQDQTYASRFVEVGTPPDRISVTGTMKFDTAQIGDRVDGDDELARAVGLSPGREPIWVCGSTGPGEELLVLEAYRALRARHPSLRLAIIPRKPERFDEVAAQIIAAGYGLVRRSQPGTPISPDAVVLGDSMGELRKFYSLGDVVFVGRSLVDLGARQHGSDMIEPAALGKAVVVGPFTHNFADAMHQFLAADAICVVQDATGLTAQINRLLNNPSQRAETGQRAREVVKRGQGATGRNLEIILRELGSSAPSPGTPGEGGGEGDFGREKSSDTPQNAP